MTTGDSDAACRPVVALVASSLAGAFDENSGNQCASAWQVTGGSSTALAAQVREGSPADVFVSAGTEAVTQLRDDGLTVGNPETLGSVRATLLTSSEHKDQTSLKDLPQLVMSGWKIGLCIATAPCGAMADQVLENATSIWGPGFDRGSLAATETESATDLRSKVAMGELDAALLYETVCVDPPNADDSGICSDIPDNVDGRPLNVKTPYVAIRLRDGATADSFMEYVTSSVFRDYLRDQLRIS